MNYSDLKSFLESQTDAAALEALIQVEAEEYKYASQAKKKPEVVMADVADEYFILDGTHFAKLCNAYLEGTLDQYELFYIGEAIQSSDNFDFAGRDVAKLFSRITNPSINGPINQKTIAGLLEGVK